VYERAIANVPPADEKRYWQRYIYLWWVMMTRTTLLDCSFFLCGFVCKLQSLSTSILLNLIWVCWILLYWRIRINYALYEELEAEDLERTREVYR
jgi:crooked neck